MDNNHERQSIYQKPRRIVESEFWAEVVIVVIGVTPILTMCIVAAIFGAIFH